MIIETSEQYERQKRNQNICGPRPGVWRTPFRGNVAVGSATEQKKTIAWVSHTRDVLRRVFKIDLSIQHRRQTKKREESDVEFFVTRAQAARPF